MNAVRSKLSQALGFDEIALESLPLDAGNRLRKSQIRGAIEQMRVFVVGNTCFAPVLAFQAWGLGLNGVVIVWTSLMLAFSWWLFFTWRISYRTDGRSADMCQFVKETKLNASLWCFGMVLFYPFVAGDAKTVLTCVMIGSLALGTVGFSHAPKAALWYLAIHAVTLSLVPFTFGILNQTSIDFLLGSLALVASAGIFNTVLERAKAQMRAFQVQEDLMHKTEVVDLMLKDYEEQGTAWIWETDVAGNIVNCPRKILDLLNLDETKMARTGLLEALKNSVEPDGQPEVIKLGTAFDEKVDLHNVTLPLRMSADGTIRWIVMKGRPQYQNGNFSGFRGFFADATATVEAKKHVEFLAKHDPLTGAYNRNFVQTVLSELDPAHDRALIFLIDLDGFKNVNDGYGHTAGDKLLQIVTNRLLGVVEDQAVVARLGGDEFLVFCKLHPSEMHFAHHQMGTQLLDCLSEPFLVNHLEISLTGSVGIAKFPQDTNQGATLLNHADLALYAAKRGGRNKCVTFIPAMMDGVQNRINVTEKLRKAVQTGCIEPYYQPQFCTKSSQIIGAEALARWNDDDLGFVAPDLFIAIAEETGLIHDLGEQLLRRACLDALRWPPRPDGTPLMLAMNLSPIEVRRGNVADKIKRILTETGFPPSRLEIEITEGVLIDDVPATRFLLEELSEAGIVISLDDFGTGYSSLSYVRALPLNRLKIDQSFVFEIEDPEAQSIVSTIINLCDRLGLEVIAEGVETQNAVNILNGLGCDVLQGYFFSRPLPANAFRELILEGIRFDFHQDMVRSKRVGPYIG
ncbi:putative bifunctional diguanylate cyclase/phosphodiesterase [Aestuariibius sp. HNIBRBA575]|uniref:putative bifunctional diguanylate cyclase/phosphodiesterase n=1 Tax=Aestuariibius sp. HNIBRBA575 TaxID=3233343 RepID=UPI0034A3C32A